jgi:hypothetical protein
VISNKHCGRHAENFRQFSSRHSAYRASIVFHVRNIRRTVTGLIANVLLGQSLGFSKVPEIFSRRHSSVDFPGEFGFIPYDQFVVAYEIITVFPLDMLNNSRWRSCPKTKYDPGARNGSASFNMARLHGYRHNKPR